MRRWVKAALLAAGACSMLLIASGVRAEEPATPASGAGEASTSEASGSGEASPPVVEAPANEPIPQPVPPEHAPLAPPEMAPPPSLAPVEPPHLEVPEPPPAEPLQWPFPWMQEAERERAERESAAEEAASAAVAEASSAALPGDVAGGSRSPVSGARGSYPVGPPDAAAAAAVADGQLPDPQAPQPVAPSGGPLQQSPATAVLAPGGATSTRSCQPDAIENGVASEKGAVMQVAVLNSDCTWTAAQVLVSYDIRGPPTVDVLSQSIGMSTNTEVDVSSDGKVTMRYGYEGPRGVLTFAAPLVLEPFSQANQGGGNRIEVVQDVSTQSGDAISGVQRVAVRVDQDATAVRVLAQNASPGASARSGDAISNNAVAGVAGPIATGTGGAQVTQTGDNDVIVDQNATATSGDAKAGSQEIEVWVSGSVGEVAILASNASPGALAISGDATATNTAGVAAGPVAGSAGGNASAAQAGNNRAVVDQSASASTGDAIAGSQVVGVVVGGDAGRVAVLASNDSGFAFAASGNATAVNAAAVQAGPAAGAVLGGASATQAGNNRVVVGQSASASTGDAIAGSQVIGVVVGGRTGQVSVLASNDAAGALAISGAAVTANLAGGNAGPVASGTGNALTQQVGHSTADVSQSIDGASGDAVSGSQVVGSVTAGVPVAVSAGDSTGVSAQPAGEASSATERVSSPELAEDAGSPALVPSPAVGGAAGVGVPVPAGAPLGAPLPVGALAM